MRNLENKYPNKLRELRIQNQMTLREVTKNLNLKSENRLCRWERGQSYPSLMNIMKLSKMYQVLVEEIYQNM
jgi:transcriptional regulator with XRE-family HTH domain